MPFLIKKVSFCRRRKNVLFPCPSLFDSLWKRLITMTTQAQHAPRVRRSWRVFERTFCSRTTTRSRGCWSRSRSIEPARLFTMKSHDLAAPSTAKVEDADLDRSHRKSFRCSRWMTVERKWFWSPLEFYISDTLMWEKNSPEERRQRCGSISLGLIVQVTVLDRHDVRD